MRQLIFLIASVVQGDEDALIVGAGSHPHAGAGEFSAKLIEPSRRDPFLRTFDDEGRDGRVMRCLFGQIRDRDGLLVGESTSGGRRDWVAVRRKHGWSWISDLPFALAAVAVSTTRTRAPCLSVEEKTTHSKELAQGRVIRFTRSALDIFLKPVRSAGHAS